MKNFLIASLFINTVLLTSCGSNYEDVAITSKPADTEVATKLTCAAPLEGTMDAIGNVLAGYVDNNNIPPQIPGVIVKRSTLVTAIKKEKVNAQVGMFMMEEQTGEKYLWLIGKKMQNYTSAKMPKLGKPGEKCCATNTVCCGNTRTVFSLCKGGECAPALTATTELITETLGGYVEDLSIPDYMPGVVINKSSLIKSISDSADVYEMNDKAGLFIIEEPDLKSNLWLIGKNPNGTTISIRCQNLGVQLVDGVICCPKDPNCCYSGIRKVVSKCEN